MPSRVLPGTTPHPGIYPHFQCLHLGISSFPQFWTQSFKCCPCRGTCSCLYSLTFSVFENLYLNFFIVSQMHDGLVNLESSQKSCWTFFFLSLDFVLTAPLLCSRNASPVCRYFHSSRHAFIPLISLSHSSFHHIHLEPYVFPLFQFFVLVSLLFDGEHSSIDSLMASTNLSCLSTQLFFLFHLPPANFSFHTFCKAHPVCMFVV